MILILAFSIFAEENNLSFIETSALDASNVETAFQNILGGKCSGRGIRNQLLILVAPMQKFTTSCPTRHSNRTARAFHLIPEAKPSRLIAQTMMGAKRRMESVVRLRM